MPFLLRNIGLCLGDISFRKECCDESPFLGTEHFTSKGGILIRVYRK